MFSIFFPIYILSMIYTLVYIIYIQLEISMVGEVKVKRERIKYYDTLRFLAILGIIVLHVSQVFHKAD